MTASCYVGPVRAWLMALFLVGCSSGSTPVPPFPMPVDLDAGPVLIGISTTGTDAGPWTAVVDTLSPLSVVDVGRLAGVPVPEAPRRHRLDLVLHGLGVQGAVPQVRFGGVSVLDLYPCGADGDTDPACLVGLTGQETPVHAVLGADLLARGAVRFAFAASRMFFFPDITGSNEDRTGLCEAVFESPFHGGGTMVLGGAEVSYSGRRIALGGCVYQEELAGCSYGKALIADTDLDGQFLVSTGLAISVVSERFYERYQAFTGAPPLADLPATMLHMPSGAIPVHLGEMRNLALVGQVNQNRGPCTERCTNACLHWKISDGAADAGPTDDAGVCPAESTSATRAGATIDLRGPFAVAIASDALPLLQALRDELRPELPEIDGILAPSALMPLVVDVDYPNNRVIARCARPDDPACLVRPAFTSQTEARQASNGQDGTCPSPAPLPDAGVPDADVPDAPLPDAEVPDAGIPDATVPDTRVVDAG